MTPSEIGFIKSIVNIFILGLSSIPISLILSNPFEAYDNLSKINIVQLVFRKICSTKWCPMNPQPPVINIFLIVIFLICIIYLNYYLHNFEHISFVNS